MAPVTVPHDEIIRSPAPIWRVLWVAVSLLPLALFLAAMAAPDERPFCVRLCPELLSCVERISR